MSETKAPYPQDTEDNEYRYLDFCWLDAMARGLTAGAEKHPGETSESHLVNASMRCMMAYATAAGAAETQGGAR